MSGKRHHQAIMALCCAHGWRRNGIRAHMRENLDIGDPSEPFISIIPDAWHFDGEDYWWIEVVKSSDLTDNKMHQLYWLKDWLEGVEVTRTQRLSGLRCIKYDMNTGAMFDFCPYEWAIKEAS